MINTSKLILTDADGVLLDWEWAFRMWMEQHGWKSLPEGRFSYKLSKRFEGLTEEAAKVMIRQFNESAAIGFLPALRDSMYYVKRLHEEYGYTFKVITSLSLDENAAKLREMNLRKLFGNAIESVVCLDTGADKDEALKPYAKTGMWWIEDKPQNADLGHTLGLRSILVEHGHNMDHRPSYPVVRNWKEIYSIVTA